MMRTLFISLVAAGIFISCAGQKGEVLSPKEFKGKLTSEVTLLDVRTDGEFKSGHLINALNIDVNSSQFESQSEKLDKAKPVYVYCKGGARASRAAQFLRKKGYKVTELNGGFDAWKEEGLPVVK